MKFLSFVLMLTLCCVLAGCKSDEDYIEVAEVTPVVFIEGDANSFYIRNGPRFQKIEPLIEYLKKNHDRIILREADKSIIFQKKLTAIFVRNGITVEKYIPFLTPEEAAEAAENKKEAETLTF